MDKKFNSIKYDDVLMDKIADCLTKTSFLNEMSVWAEPDDVVIREINISDYLPKIVTDNMNIGSDVSFIEIYMEDAECEGHAGFICKVHKDTISITEVVYIVLYDENSIVWDITKVFNEGIGINE